MCFTFNNRNQTSQCSYCPLRTIAFFKQDKYFLGMVFKWSSQFAFYDQHIIQKQPQIWCSMMLVILQFSESSCAEDATRAAALRPLEV